MSVHGLIHDGEHPVGDYVIRRRPSGTHDYDWAVNFPGRYHRTGRITHHHDGTGLLVAAVLTAAETQETE